MASRGDPALARPLRIVHCFRNPVGGLFRHVRDLCRAQAEAGHSVGIICDSTTGGMFERTLFEEIAPSLSLGLTRLPMSRQIGPGDVGSYRRVLHAAAPLRPDVLHGHGAKGGAYARMAGSRLRRTTAKPVARIYTPHGGSLHYDPARLKNRLYFTAERFLTKRTDAFVFVSQYEADAFGDKVGRPNCTVRIVPNGLQPSEFEPIQLKSDASDFLYVGMLRDLKGPDVFIEALSALPGASARIYGAGEDANRYRTMIAELGLTNLVTFHEPTPAREAFATGRVLVVPSRAESMPYIVLEAAAGSVPIIATSVGGIPEIFRDEARRLVPPGDAKALAAAMKAYADDPDRAVQDAARMKSTVAGAHTVGTMAIAIEDVYRQVLAA